MRLSGDLIEMTGTQVADSVPAVGRLQSPEHESGMDLSRINPKEMTAAGNVVLTHKGVTGHVRQKLTVSFAEEAADSGSADKVRMVSQTKNQADSSEAEGVTEFFCDTAKANISFGRDVEHKAWSVEGCVAVWQSEDCPHGCQKRQ